MILVAQHNRLFKKCYPDATLTPKMHYMVHFSSQLLQYVAIYYEYVVHCIYFIMQCWSCLGVCGWRLKMPISNNFKNVAYSVSKRHQRLLCAHLQGKFFSFDDLECGPCEKIGACSYTCHSLCMQVKEFVH